MYLFELAAQLNNEGVTALLEGEQQTAFHVLTKSIKLMKQELAKNPTTQLGSKSSGSLKDQETVCVKIPDMATSESIVFNHVMTIPTRVSKATPDLEEIHIFSAVVIFNLAMAHHHHASSQPLDTNSLKNAEKLYYLVLQLLVDHAASSRTAILLTLGSISNLSQIRFVMGDVEQAQAGLRQMSHYIQGVNQAVFEDSAIERLFMKALLYQAPDAATVAVATAA
jgi:hypothetical protein